MEEYEDMVLAREADTEVAEEKKALRDKVKKLQESLKRAQKIKILPKKTVSLEMLCIL